MLQIKVLCLNKLNATKVHLILFWRPLREEKNDPIAYFIYAILMSRFFCVEATGKKSILNHFLIDVVNIKETFMFSKKRKKP